MAFGNWQRLRPGAMAAHVGDAMAHQREDRTRERCEIAVGMSCVDVFASRHDVFAM